MWHVTKTEKHWSNEQTMKKYFTKPYIQEKRTALKVGSEQAALLIFDNFRPQCTPLVLSLLDRHIVKCDLDSTQLYR